MESIEAIMASLPPEHQQEVRDFAMFLAEKRAKPKRRRLRLDWAGGLKEFRDHYTSLELQKDSLDWWAIEVLLDTNVWLELLLQQERAAEVRRFLQSIDADQLSMTEFALNSIGLITSRWRKEDIYAGLLFASKTLQDASFVPIAAEAV